MMQINFAWATFVKMIGLYQPLCDCILQLSGVRCIDFGNNLLRTIISKIPFSTNIISHKLYLGNFPQDAPVKGS